MSYAIYSQFHSIERRAAVELADALPFMAWSPAAVCGANIARHGAVQFGRMARVEYELWGGNARLLQLLRAVARQVGKAAIHAAVYVGYAVLVAVALVYHYGSEWISSYVEASQQVSPVVAASHEVMAEMEIRTVADEEVCSDAELGDNDEPAVEPLTVDDPNYSIAQLRNLCRQQGLGVRNPKTGKAWKKAEAMEVLGLV